MKKIFFLTHDPGGYEAVKPVYDMCRLRCIDSEFYGVGPSAIREPSHALAAEQVISILNEAISTNSIAMLVTGTSWGNETEREAISLCKKSNILTVAILDYWSNYLTRFQLHDQTVVFPDVYIVMDEIARNEAIDAGVPNHILQILGNPGLDRWTRFRFSNHKHSNMLRTALLISQPLSLLYGESLGYTELEVIEDCLRTFRFRGGWQFHIRFHPKESDDVRTRYAAYIREGDMQEALEDADLLIGMSSMALLQGVLMGKAAISYQPNLLREDMCITNKLGMTRLLTNFGELNKAIDSFNGDFQTNPATPLPPTLDGNATERVYHFLKSLLEQE